MKLRNIVLAAVLITFFTACKLNIAVSKSDLSVADLSKIATNSEAMYNKMLSSPDKTFGTYIPDYVALSANIDTLIIHDKARSNPKKILIMDDYLQKAQLKFEQEHLTITTASNEMISGWQKYLRAYIVARKNAENHTK